MTPLRTALGLLLPFSFCLLLRAEEPPKQPDLQRYKAFALRLQNLVRENKIEEVQGCFDEDALIERVLHDLRFPAGVRKGIVEGMKEKSFARGMFEVIGKAVQQQSSYTFLRVHRVEGQPRALFRLLINNGLNYHDLVLSNNAEGEPRIVDLYVAVSGEFASETMRRMACLMISGDPRQSDQLKIGNDFQKNRERIVRFLHNTRERHYREALKDWSALPPAVQKEKIICLSRVMCTMGLADEDEKNYVEAMEAFRKAFPKDASVDLMTLDHYFLKRRFVAFHRGIDRIERTFGPDPYLDVLRTSAFVEEGKLEEAKQAVRRAVKDEPGLQAAYWAALRVSLRCRDFKDAVRWIAEIEKRFKIEFADLNEEEEFREFVKSPEYQEWMKQRKKF